MRSIAAVMYEQGLGAPYIESKPLKIEEIHVDGPKAGEVLVEIRAAGLCHSDLSQVAGLRKRTVPVVMGHEGAGIVREVGPGVNGLMAGDHVVMTVGSGCGHCRYCAGQRPVLCEAVSASRAAGFLMSGRSALNRGQTPLFHHSGISSFSQYAVTVPGSLVKIDQAVPLDVAALFGCAVVTGAGCVFNAARVQAGHSVAVIGLGGVGLCSVMAAKVAGASEIIGIDINEEKFPLARELGCTHTISARDSDLVQQVKDLTGGGVDFAFEISGSKPAMAAAIAITCKGGEVVGVGMGSSSELYEYAHTLLVSEEKVFRGSLMGSCVPERDIPRYLAYYQQGVMPVDRLMTGSIGFEDLNLALDRLNQGAVLRQVLLPNG